MQHKSRAAWISVASASVLAAACATGIEPDLSDDIAEGSSGQGGAGKGGAVSTGGGGSAMNGGKSGAGAGGTDSGVANGGGGSNNVQDGGEGGVDGTGATTSGGKGGRETGGAGAGGKGGSSTGGGGNGGSGNAGSGSGGGGSANGGGTGNVGGGGGGGTNLIGNSGFETNTTGWSVFGGSATIATTTDQAHSGTRSLAITGRSQTYQGPEYSVLSLVTPGTSYSLSLWGRLPASDPTGSLTVTLHYSCSGGSSAGENYMRWVATTAASASSWVQFSGTKAFPACAGGGSMTAASFYVESPSATLSYYIDDVVLTAQ